MPGNVRDPLWDSAGFRAFLSVGGQVVPNPIVGGPQTFRPVTPAPNPYTNPYMLPGNSTNIPTTQVVFNWGTNVVPGSAKYMWVKSPTVNNFYWLLTEITLAADFDDPGTPAVLPSTR